VLANRRILRLRDVIAVGFAGVVTADWIIYLAGRRYGPGFVTHPWLARLFGAARMDAVRHAVERHGARAVFFARFMLGFRIATIPRSAALKIGAFGFVFTATMVAARRSPTRCSMAPLTPSAT